MKSTLDVIDYLFGLLENSVLSDSISGSVFRHSRPDNSPLEDVVINCLPVSGNQIQVGAANVNIYVPDLVLEADGKTQYAPDFTRLKSLAQMALTIIADYSLEDYLVQVENQSVIKEAELHQHFINIRIKFKTCNF